MKNFAISLFQIASQDDGHAEFCFLVIEWNGRSGSLFGIQWCPECGAGLDLFWIGLACEPTK